MTKLKNTFKTDILFKLLFVKHPELLRRLVAHILRIPFDSIKEFDIKNPEMPPEIIGNKFCRLDIHMVVEGRQVNLEVQVEDEKDFPERAMYHWARAYSNALPAGGKYADLPRTIVISILAFDQFPCAEFYSEYHVLEVTRRTPLTDKQVYYFFELGKLPDEMSKDDLLLLWLALFKADTEEELAKLDALEVAELSQAISAYHNVTASPEFRELERLRAKAQHDEASALHNERRKEKLDVARKALQKKLSVDDVMDITGLTRAEVEGLRDAN
jgi:predicted transposase/invertase (TIGR01784 family)